MEFDKWELLAAFQALLVYCLLRLQEVPAGNDGFEAALLTTVNVSERQTDFSTVMPSTLTTTQACVQCASIVGRWDPQDESSRPPRRDLDGLGLQRIKKTVSTVANVLFKFILQYNSY